MCWKAQAAAAEVATENPGGIDYLIVNAGINDCHVGPSLDMCAAAHLTSALQLGAPEMMTLRHEVADGMARLLYVRGRRDVADFRRVFEVNVIGAFASIQAFYPLVKVRRSCTAARVYRYCLQANDIACSCSHACQHAGVLRVRHRCRRCTKRPIECACSCRQIGWFTKDEILFHGHTGEAGRQESRRGAQLRRGIQRERVRRCQGLRQAAGADRRHAAGVPAIQGGHQSMCDSVQG